MATLGAQETLTPKESLCNQPFGYNPLWASSKPWPPKHLLWPIVLGRRVTSRSQDTLDAKVPHVARTLGHMGRLLLWPRACCS
ncbi:hypothetical protein GW17_00059539 [Ensete ventricosum]|nr:hypothetical protein GW17_00059539 [Ensete ventricosum]RZR86184.1 hypothetical protein BHM03_00013327 [Ensete ventricosum]